MIDCKKLAKTVISKKEISSKNKIIYNELLKDLGDPNFKELKTKHINRF